MVFMVAESYITITLFVFSCMITICSIICCFASIRALICTELSKEIKVKIKLAVGFIIVIFAIQSVLYSMECAVIVFSFGFTYDIRWTMYEYVTLFLWMLLPLPFIGLYSLFGIKLIYSFKDSLFEVKYIETTSFV